MIPILVLAAFLTVGAKLQSETLGRRVIYLIDRSKQNPLTTLTDKERKAACHIWFAELREDKIKQWSCTDYNIKEMKK